MPGHSQRSAEGSIPSLGDEVWDRLERILERFEDAWRRGERPVVDDYLAQAEPGTRLVLLLELLHTDLHYRADSGAGADVAGYLRRYPELADDPAVVEPIATEFALRQRRDGSCAVAEYLQ